jgi:hypothetical protein
VRAEKGMKAWKEWYEGTKALSSPLFVVPGSQVTLIDKQHPASSFRRLLQEISTNSSLYHIQLKQHVTPSSPLLHQPQRHHRRCRRYGVRCSSSYVPSISLSPSRGLFLPISHQTPNSSSFFNKLTVTS